MTQEDKELLLKDLCGRLPYGVKIVIQDTFKYSIVPREYHVLDASNFSDIFCFNYKKFDKHMKKAMRERPNDIVIKPYLFPLSSMTKVQEDEWYEVFINPLSKRLDSRHTRQEDLQLQSDAQAFGVEYLLKNHFDIYGLIPMGLANDATGLNIY